MKEDIKILNTKTDIELADLWCSFNKYDCPKEFRHHEEEFKRIESLSLKNWKRDNLISRLIEEIEKRIPHKLISRRWNIRSLNNEEFEDFYNGNYCEDKEAKKRDGIRSMKKIAEKYNALDKIDWTKDFKEIERQFSNIEC